MTTYVIAAELYDGWAKIGRTWRADSAQRLASCQCGNPRRLREVAVWDADCEAFLHRHFAALRGVGEWFALPSSVLADMAGATDARGYLGVAIRWPADRILALCPAAEGNPQRLAEAFAFAADAFRTAHDRPREAPNAP